jgi:hypothetical protein
MMIKTLTYRDLTQVQRTKGAQIAREKFFGFLSNPFLSNEQQQAVHEKIALIGLWEKLQLDAVLHPLAASPARIAQHHDVGLTETVPLKDKVS